jgi:hypothetical protein
MIRWALLMAICVSISACGSPTSPSSTFTVSGTVYHEGRAFAGASVTIMDGVHAGQVQTTGAGGTFSFTDLTPDLFTLQARTTDGLAQDKAVRLTMSQSVNFDLVNYCAVIPEFC